MALAVSQKLADGALEKAVPPNQSLYIQNLPEKLQKYDLKRALYMLFSTYGPVIDIVAVKSAKMRGQAHVLFRDIPSATQAMRNCQGFEFFGREMKISYAKSKSHALLKLTGTFYTPTSQNTTTAPAGQQQRQVPSSFPAPPGSLPGPPNGLPPPPGLPQAAGALQAPANAAAQNAPSPSGTKRPRDESDDEEGAPMDEEDDDSGAEMEMSDDD